MWAGSADRPRSRSPEYSLLLDTSFLHHPSLDMVEHHLPACATPAWAEDLPGLPPTFISVGGPDEFRDEKIERAQRLSQAGVPPELHFYPCARPGHQMFPIRMVA